MAEYTNVTSDGDHYYHVTDELLGGIYFSFPYTVLIDTNVVGQ